MAASKYPTLFGKKLSHFKAAIISLKRENANMNRILVELCHQHVLLSELIESYFSPVTTRLKTTQSNGEQPVNKDEASPPDDDVTELQKKLQDALKKNKQWLEYEHVREAYVRAILDKVICLEKQLINIEQHNKEHSDEKMSHMQEHYESMLQKAKDEITVLREKVDLDQQNMTVTQSWCEKKEREVEDLKQQLQTKRMNWRDKERFDRAEDDDKSLSDGTEEHQEELDEQMRRSADSELEKCFLIHQLEDRKKIEELQRQVQIFEQDLEDEKQNCSYLKKQMVRVLRALQRKKGGTKRKVGAQCSCEVDHHEVSRISMTSPPQKNLLNESILICPNCPAEYPVSHYRELMEHLDVCLD